MITKQQWQFALCVLLSITVFSLTACGPANPENEAVSSSNKTNMQRLVNLYMLHQQQNEYAGPEDKEAFVEFINKTDPRRLKLMNVEADAIDDLFISDRDGEEFAIRYNIMSGPHGCTEPAIFEKTGSDGKRMVGFLNMVQKEVEATEYDSLMAGKNTGSDETVTSSRKSGDDRSGR